MTAHDSAADERFISRPPGVIPTPAELFLTHLVKGSTRGDLLQKGIVTVESSEITEATKRSRCITQKLLVADC